MTASTVSLVSSDKFEKICLGHMIYRCDWEISNRYRRFLSTGGSESSSSCIQYGFTNK